MEWLHTGIVPVLCTIISIIVSMGNVSVLLQWYLWHPVASFNNATDLAYEVESHLDTVKGGNFVTFFALFNFFLEKFF